MIQFDNPVTAGVVLVRSAIQSPDYATGTSGWSVNIDGSAEFNNLTIRGEFLGTQFILNADGAFFYDSAPALNHLTFSIASDQGTDPVGNAYIPGFVAYDVGSHTGPIEYIQMIQGTIFIGDISGGVFQSQSDAATFGSSVQRAFMNSGLDTSIPANTDQACFDLLCGIANAVSGGASTPYAILWDFSIANSPVDFYLSGSVLHVDNNGNRATWQVPALGTNYNLTGTNGLTTIRFRRTENNRVRVYGAFNVATAGVQSLFTVPVGYRPALQGYLTGGTANAATPVTMAFKMSVAGVVTPSASLSTGVWYINDEIEIGDIP